VIDAILWDFGGVLTTSPFEAFNRYESERGIPLDFIRRVNATNAESNAWAQFESSSVDIDGFDVLFAEESALLGHRIPGREVIALLSGDVRPRMVDMLRRCKSRFRVACITNNVRSGAGPGMASTSERAERVAEVMALFDVVVESSVEGIRKPDPRIYRLTCERLGVEPHRAVFIDDLGINLKPAKLLGMRTIKVLDEEQAIRELAEVTGLPAV
jgi:putative hydrolase of the HAD superfamily